MPTFEVTLRDRTVETVDGADGQPAGVGAGAGDQWTNAGS
jgi:hypothetical protein